MNGILSFQVDTRRVGEKVFDIKEFTEAEYDRFEKQQNRFPRLYKVVKYERNREPKIFIQMIIKQTIPSQKRYQAEQYTHESFTQSHVDLLDRQWIYENNKFTYTVILLDIQDLTEVLKKDWEIQEKQGGYQVVEKGEDNLLSEVILSKTNVKYRNKNPFNNIRGNLLSKTSFQDILNYKESSDYKTKQYDITNQFEDGTIYSITIETNDILIKPVVYKGQEAMFRNIERKDNGLQEDLRQKVQDQDQQILRKIQQIEEEENKKAQQEQRNYQVRIYLMKFSKEAKCILNKTRIMQQKIGETPLRSSKYNNCVLQQVLGMLYYGKTGEEKYIQKRNGRRLDFTRNNIVPK